MTFGQAFVGTWRAILRSRTLLSTMLLSVALYGFYYPAPYAHETAQRLPVIIVDQDNSALSRAMVRDLDATRAVEIVATASDVAEARRRMRRGDADGVILVTQGLERQLRTGAPGAGIGVWVNATYLLRASTIGEAITSVVEDLAAERLLPPRPDRRGRSSGTASGGGGRSVVRPPPRPDALPRRRVRFRQVGDVDDDHGPQPWDERSDLRCDRFRR